MWKRGIRGHPTFQPGLSTKSFREHLAAARCWVCAPSLQGTKSTRWCSWHFHATSSSLRSRRAQLQHAEVTAADMITICKQWFINIVCFIESWQVQQLNTLTCYNCLENMHKNICILLYRSYAKIHTGKSNFFFLFFLNSLLAGFDNNFWSGFSCLKPNYNEQRFTSR